MMSRLRVGVIGCGGIAQIQHLPHLVELSSDFEVAGLCDLSRELLAHVGAAYGVPPERRHVEYHELVQRADIDAVIVCNSGTHAPPAIAAARAGKHILVEKPVCYTVAEARAIAGPGGDRRRDSHRCCARDVPVVGAACTRRWTPGGSFRRPATLARRLPPLSGRHDADAATYVCTLTHGVVAADERAAGRGFQQGGDHLHGRRLAGAVRAQQAEALARRNPQDQIAHRHDRLAG